MKFHNIYFINGTAYAGKSTLVKGLAAELFRLPRREGAKDP